MSWLLSAQSERETGVSELSRCHKIRENRQLDRKERSRSCKATARVHPVSGTRKWHCKGTDMWKSLNGRLQSAKR